MIEKGVLKYLLKFNKTSEVALKECSKIEKVRSRLFALGLIGTSFNKKEYGDISLRYKKKNSFVITGTQTGELPKLNTNYYSFVKKVDFKKFTIYAIGPCKPSCESIIHACIYNLDPQIKAAIYIYNEKIWEYMQKNSYLTINDKSNGTFEMLEDIKSIYKNVDPLLNNAFVIKGYSKGIVTFGKSLSDAEKALYSIIQKLLD